MPDRTARRIGSSNGWWSVFGKAQGRGKGKKVGPPVHVDLVQREFVADAPNRLWVMDITEHRTGKGKLYLCAIKDVFSNKIVGYSIDSRMKSRLVVNAIDNAAALRGDIAGCVVHSDSETVHAGVLGGPDPHSDGRARMLVPGVLRGS